jgi:hypothetical protein
MVKMDSLLDIFQEICKTKIFFASMILISLLLYLRYKLTFWKRQGIPNVIFHTYKLINNVTHLNDFDCIKAHGKIVG